MDVFSGAALLLPLRRKFMSGKLVQIRVHLTAGCAHGDLLKRLAAGRICLPYSRYASYQDSASSTTASGLVDSSGRPLLSVSRVKSAVTTS